jgi:hypothetical protein
MDVDANNDVHIVYSRPAENGADEILYQRRAAGEWLPAQRLSSDGLRSSNSTHLIVDAQGVVHLCYLRRTTESLYYRRIENDALGVELLVDNGAWHTRMQLDRAGRPMFAREDQTWPEGASRLELLTTTDGATWNGRLLNVPAQVQAFRLADFLYVAENYHLTFGDSAQTRPVLAGKGSSAYVDGLFHNLYYATSGDGTQWDVRLVDDSSTLYENEFWTALAVDQGNPIVGFYQYAEYDNQYNTGTSAIVSRWNGSAWDRDQATRAWYEATRAGMGIALLVRSPGTYLGAWDFSPDDTYDPNFRGPRGNIAIVRNGEDNGWQDKLQLEPFSAEGRIVIRQQGDRLHLLVLGDFVDAKLYYRELDLNEIDRRFAVISSGFPWSSFLPAILRAGHR